MSTTTTTTMKILCAWMAVAGVLPGCKTEKPADAPKPCCDQPQIPAGVTPFKIVVDEVKGPSDGQLVTIRAAVLEAVSREQVYPILHTIYRHAMKRNAFEPIEFSAALYGDEENARRGNTETLVGEIRRGRGDIAPRCEIRRAFDFPEQVARAFAASIGRLEEEDPNDTCHLAAKKPGGRFDQTFKHKPEYKVDAARSAVEVTFPYLQDGKDEWAAELTYNAAMRYWVEFTTNMFRKVDGLKEVTFVGVHRNDPVVRIVVTRDQFNRGLSSLQEEIASHAAVTFAKLGMGHTSDKGAEKEQIEHHKKTYKAALAQLPKSQVSISPRLK